MANRTIEVGGIWADGAPDVPGGGTPPTPLVTYAKSDLSLAEIVAAWPYTKIVDSATHNELLRRLTALMIDLEQGGILNYSALTDYVVGALAQGSNGELYRTLIVNGPASSVVDPVGDATGTWEMALFVSASSVRSVTTTGAVLASDRVVVIDATSGNVNLTFLSAANAAAKTIKIQRARGDSSNNTVTLLPQGGETIGGGSSVVLLAGENYEFIPDGSIDYLQF